MEEKLREISLKPYKNKTAEGEREYNVKDNLISIIFNRQLGLSGEEIYKRQGLSGKIENCKNSELILEENEYEIVKKTFQKLKGFGSGDRELIRRIFEAKKLKD